MAKRGGFGHEFGGRGGRGRDCGGRGRGVCRRRRDTEEEKWRTRFKAFVVIGDGNCHVGLGVKCSKKVATTIRGAIILAKWLVIPVRRGYWGNKIGKPHTVPCKVTGKCGSITVRMVPTLRGDGIVVARVPKKITSGGEGNRPHPDKILMSTARRNLGCL
ncbi:40S ribosomal protein S2 [Capsicum annuum]|nr:40S ribosomal protein S2 [Capsicum annuum]